MFAYSLAGFRQKTRPKKWQGGHFLGLSGVPPFGSIPLVALRTPAGTGLRPPLQSLPCINMLHTYRPTQPTVMLNRLMSLSNHRVCAR